LGLWRLGFWRELFVAPGHQSRGAGNELLARTFAHGLITFTFNVVSQGLYIRHGPFPRLPIYVVSVARDVDESSARRQASLYGLPSQTLVHLAKNRTV
jgi:hypothetical protein